MTNIRHHNEIELFRSVLIKYEFSVLFFLAMLFFLFPSVAEAQRCGATCRDCQFVCAGWPTPTGFCGWECQDSGIICEAEMWCPYGTVPDWTPPLPVACIHWGSLCGNMLRRGGWLPCGNLYCDEDGDGIQDIFPCKLSPTEIAHCVPIFQPLVGYVWDDRNSNGAFDTNEVWGSSATAACSSSISDTMTVMRTDVAPTAGTTWQCNGGSPNSPYFATESYPGSSTASFRLTPPSTISCTDVTWTSTVCENVGCTAYHNQSGLGCDATLTNYSGSFTNIIYWKVRSVVNRTVNGTLFKTDNPGTCSQNGGLGLPGLSAKLYSGATQVGTTATVDQGSSTFTISPVLSNQTIDSLCISGNLSTATESYQLSCVRGTGVTCTPGSGACAINCTPTTALSTGDVTINTGYTAFANKKWFTSLDGDMYADAISTYVATTPAGGFTKYLINTRSAASVGGFGFAGINIDTQTTGTGVSERGGAAQRLNTNPLYSFRDKWFEKFAFTPPSDAIATPPNNNRFKKGEVYSLDVGQFNQVLSQGSYRITDSNNATIDAVIVYVTGGGTINITSNFISDSTNHMMLLVTDADVHIGTNVGVSPTSTFSINSPSQVDLAILSSQDITTESIYDQATLTFDKPLMVLGSMMSRGTLNLKRNLGGIDNAAFPAEAIRFYPYLMNLIAKYERANSNHASYTGLTTMDVQYDYGN